MTEQSTMTVRRASDMTMPPKPRWLARGWLPRAELTVLVGEEGIGKSLAWVTLVAHITTGRPMPEVNLPHRAPEDVVLVLTEDSWGIVSGRLEAAGADLTRVHVFSEEDDGTGSPVFPQDQKRLLAWALQSGIRPALVVVDAWLDTVSAGLRVRDTQQAREALTPWGAVAQKTAAAVLLLTHTNRLDSGDTRDLMGATVGLRQKARMVLFAARDPEDEQGTDKHVWIGPDKSNTTGILNALRFTVSVKRVQSDDPDDLDTIATLIDPQDAGATIKTLVRSWHRDDRNRGKPQNAADRAAEWIHAFVSERGGTVLTSEVRAAAHGAGHGEHATDTAMKSLGTNRPPHKGAPWVFTLAGIQVSAAVPISQESAESTDTADTAESRSGAKNPQIPQSRQSPQCGTPLRTLAEASA